MRRALIVCYYFPPMGLAGVGRPLNLFKCLPRFGWDCHVLTVKPVAYRAYEPELLDGLDTQKIFRSGSYDPQRLMYLAGWRTVSGKALSTGLAVRNRIFPDSKRGWIAPAVRLGKRLAQKHEYDIILSTAPPISAHLVARQIHRATGIKWVADYRDYWTSSTIEDSYSDERKAGRARQLLKSIAEESSAVTAVNDSVGAYVGSRLTISNGFDSHLAQLWKPPADSIRFAIGLLGTFGAINPLEPLFDVLERLRTDSPEKFADVEIIQVGNANQQELKAHASRLNMAERCHLYGLRPRDESIELLKECRCFYLSILPHWGKGITSARIFDLLASGRPILAYADRGGEIDRLINKTQSGFAFDGSGVGEAADYLNAVIAAQNDGTRPIKPLPAYAEPYRWERITEQFTKLFDSLL